MEKYGIKPLLHGLMNPPKKKFKHYPVTAAKSSPAPVVKVNMNKDDVLERVVGATLRSLKDNNINLKDAIRRRQNPCSIETAQFFYHSIDFLLSSLAFTAGELASHLQTALGVSEKAAISYADIAIRILIRTGSATRETTRWAVVPCPTLEDEEVV